MNDFLVPGSLVQSLLYREERPWATFCRLTEFHIRRPYSKEFLRSVCDRCGVSTRAPRSPPIAFGELPFATIHETAVCIARIGECLETKLICQFSAFLWLVVTPVKSAVSTCISTLNRETPNQFLLVIQIAAHRVGHISRYARGFSHLRETGFPWIRKRNPTWRQSRGSCGALIRKCVCSPCGIAQRLGLTILKRQAVAEQAKQKEKPITKYADHISSFNVFIGASAR